MARDWSKVEGRFWTGETGRRLRQDRDGQVLALYLMTCRHATAIGLYHVGIATMSRETGIAEPELRAALARLEALDYCRWDEEWDLVWVRSMAPRQLLGAGQEQMKAGDKRVVAVATSLAEIPDCGLKRAWYKRHAHTFHQAPSVEELGKPHLDAPLDAPSIPASDGPSDAPTGSPIASPSRASRAEQSRAERGESLQDSPPRSDAGSSTTAPDSEGGAALQGAPPPPSRAPRNHRAEKRPASHREQHDPGSAEDVMSKEDAATALARMEEEAARRGFVIQGSTAKRVETTTTTTSPRANGATAAALTALAFWNEKAGRNDEPRGEDGLPSIAVTHLGHLLQSRDLAQVRATIAWAAHNVESTDLVPDILDEARFAELERRRRGVGQ